MALSTYTELKTSIANWLNRSDLTDEISDDFIKLVESEYNSKLRIRKMQTTDSAFSVSAETVALPTGFLQVRDFYIVQGAVKKPGALRKSLKIKKGQKIPLKKLKAAAKKSGKLGQRARLAITLRKLSRNR